MNVFTKLVIIWIIILTLLYSTLAILRHNHFQSGGFDLGIYDQAVWQYANFIYPDNTIKERFILGDHLTLTLPLLAPLFWLWDDVRILLIFQAFWVSFSCWPIYKLAKERNFSALTASILAFIYGFFYGFQFMVLADFHPVVIGVGLLAWTAYFLETGQKKFCLISLVLLLLTQENMGLALAGLGLIYVFKKDYRKWAVSFIIGGLVACLAAIKLISFFSPAGFEYWPKINLQPVGLAADFFNAAEKRQVWLYSLSWFSFLPLLSPGAMLAVFLDLAQYFVTGEELRRMWSPLMHHRAILAPFLFLGILDGLAFLKGKGVNLKIVVFLMLLVASFCQYYLHFPLNKLSKKIYWQEEAWMKHNRELLKIVPQKAGLAAQQNLVPHLTHRQQIYLAWPRQHDFEEEPCGQKTCWWLDFGGEPEYLVVDLRPNQWLTQILETNENFASAVENMEKAGKIVLEKELGLAKLYKIND